METKEYIYYNILKAPNDAIIMLFSLIPICSIVAKRIELKGSSLHHAEWITLKTLALTPINKIELLHLIMH
jgi:hypothetical protein